MTQEKVFHCYVPDSHGGNLAEAIAKLSKPAKYDDWASVTAKMADEKFTVLYSLEGSSTPKTILDLPVETVKKVTTEMVSISDQRGKAFKESLGYGVLIGLGFTAIVAFLAGTDNIILSGTIIVLGFCIVIGIIMALIWGFRPKMAKIPGDTIEFKIWYDDKSFIPIFIDPYKEDDFMNSLKEAGVVLEENKQEDSIQNKNDTK